MFSRHMAEPGGAASIYQRNPHDPTDIPIKIASMRSNSLSYPYNPLIPSLSAVKQIHNREYSQKSGFPSVVCAKTVGKSDFSPKTTEIKQIPVAENWLYLTKPQKYKVKPEETFTVSGPAPDWFKNQQNLNPEISEPTITVLNKLSGWITVSSKSRNRKNRLEKNNLSGTERINIQKVSELAPGWMQGDRNNAPANTLKNFKPPPLLRQEQKRLILVEGQEAEKSLYSFGDFRHNVRTTEEVEVFNKTASSHPKKFIEWKEDSSKQRFDKPLTEKIGAKRTLN